MDKNVLIILCVYLTQADQIEAQSFYSKTIQKNSYIIPNPVKDNLPYASCNSSKRICAVGRLNKQKNYSLLIKAFHKFSHFFPDYHLEIYGKGILEKELKEQIELLNLTEKVYLKGFSENVHELIKNCEFYIMSSDYEGIPNSLLEALSMGLPCISSDCPAGGPRELIENGENGLLFKVGDLDDLVKQMVRLASNKNYRNKLGLNAKKIRNVYSSSLITKKWKEIIEENISK